MSVLQQEFECAPTMHEDATMKSRPGIGLNRLIAAAAGHLEINHTSLSPSLSLSYSLFFCSWKLMCNTERML
jgi:hypothetical protein